MPLEIFWVNVLYILYFITVIYCNHVTRGSLRRMMEELVKG